MPVHGAGPPVGTLLQHRYRVAARIASGGMGTVYRGWDERLDRAVALKLLHPHLADDDEVRARFAGEARHAAKVRHANVVAVLDADEQDGQPFIVMELVDGPSLRDVLRARLRLQPDELLRFMTAVCAGLEAVHRVGLVHRDIKPENLLQDAAGEVRVADFGIARALDSTRLTPAGSLLGSVQYIAPEIVLGGQATAASDQYALGIVAFEALTGRTPLPAEAPLAAALRHAREEVPPPSSVWPAVTPEMDRVVLTATARDPAQRFGSLQLFLGALASAVAGAGAGNGTRAGARARTDLLPAPTAPTRRGDAPATPPAEAPPAEAPPAEAPRIEQRHIYVRAHMSALAIAALAFTLVQAGAIVAPLLGFVALRRIDRSHGALRGDAVAGMAIVFGLLRLAVEVSQRF